MLVGISMPGLLNRREGKGLFSPNMHLTDGRAPGKDLSRRLGIDCVVCQESHALCLAEGAYGLARNLDDFAMLDVSTRTPGRRSGSTTSVAPEVKPKKMSKRPLITPGG